MTLPDQLLGQVGHDTLGASIAGRRHTFDQGSNLGDPHRFDFPIVFTRLNASPRRSPQANQRTTAKKAASKKRNEPCGPSGVSIASSQKTRFENDMGRFIRAMIALAMVGIAFSAVPEPFTQAAVLRLSQSADQSRPATQDQSVPTTQVPAPAGQKSNDEDVTQAKTEDGTPATVIDDRDAEAILGKSVYSASNEDMGRIVDVIVKRNGEVRAAVIDFGGFLGVGSRKIAVDWSALRFPSSGPMDYINLELTRDQVRLAPEFIPGEPLVVLGSAEGAQPSPEPPAPEQ